MPKPVSTQVQKVVIPAGKEAPRNKRSPLKSKASKGIELENQATKKEWKRPTKAPSIYVKLLAQHSNFLMNQKKQIKDTSKHL
jgi:hypothetical protein